MNVLIFDTETTSLDKPFCYDLGYTILDIESDEVLCSRHFIIEQVWHNLPLFQSAYYADKRPEYVALMRAHRAQLVKWGQATQQMARDIKAFNITDTYAYNSTFDTKVFDYCCDWFKTINPLDNVGIHDIWGYASQFITGKNDYRAFCEEHELFTQTGNYSGSAETVYRFITKDPEFVEKHMGLYDSQIEARILMYCLTMGAALNTDYKVNTILKRPQEKDFTIKVNGAIILQGKYIRKWCKNDTYNFTTVSGD